MARNLTLMALCLTSTLFQGAKPAPAQEPDDEGYPDPTDVRKRYVPGPHQPVVTADSHGVHQFLFEIDHSVKRIAFVCEQDKSAAALSGEQSRELREAGLAVLEREMRDKPELIWMLGNMITDEMNTPYGESVTRAEARMYGAFMARDMALRGRLFKAVYDRFRSIGSKEQVAACAYMGRPYGYGGTDLIEKNIQNGERRRRGDFTEDEMSGPFAYPRIDPDSSADPKDVRLPKLEAYCLQFLAGRALTYRIRYRFTAEQETAADAVVKDCAARAERAFESGDAELGRLWTDLVVALVEPEKARVPYAEAVWRFRRESERLLMPFAEEIEKRLDALVTSEQRAKAKTPPPKPEWLVLTEQMEADWDARMTKRQGPGASDGRP